MDHYFPNEFSMWVGRDKWHSTFSGRIAYLVFNGGQGAFKTENYGTPKKDIFNYNLGKDSLKGDEDKPVPLDDLREQEILASANDGDIKFE